MISDRRNIIGKVLNCVILCVNRNNGFTKIQVLSGFETDEKDMDKPTLQVAVGMMALLDLVTNSFMRIITSDYLVITGQQPMPVVIIANEQVTKLLNLIGANLYPLSLSLLLPIYMYAIVYEKEEKLI